jgi:rubrerythrin
MTTRLSRAELLSTGAKRGAAVVVAGSAFGAFASRAAADPLSDNDLALARMLVGAELLAIDFYQRALKAARFGPVGQKYLSTASADEVEHNRTVSEILTGAGYTAATAADFEFIYPKPTFASRGAIAKLARQLETTFLGAYLGAVASVQAPALVQPFARVAASEAQHLTLWGIELGGRPLSEAFPAPLTPDQVTAALAQFTT